MAGRKHLKEWSEEARAEATRMVSEAARDARRMDVSGMDFDSRYHVQSLKRDADEFREIMAPDEPGEISMTDDALDTVEAVLKDAREVMRLETERLHANCPADPDPDGADVMLEIKALEKDMDWLDATLAGPKTDRERGLDAMLDVAQEAFDGVSYEVDEIAKTGDLDDGEMDAQRKAVRRHEAVFDAICDGRMDEPGLLSGLQESARFVGWHDPAAEESTAAVAREIAGAQSLEEAILAASDKTRELDAAAKEPAERERFSM